MNNWNFNEVTQSDILDFKACKHNQTGKIYGIKDSSDCQSGKEIDAKELDEMVKKANSGDAKAKKQLEEYRKAKAKGKQETAKEKAEKEAKEKAAKDPKKKGKGGKGKKGGGKGKGGKGAKVAKGGSSLDTKADPAKAKQTQQRAAQARAARAKQVRARIQELQKTLRQIKNPEVRKALEEQISTALKSVSDMLAGKQSAASTAEPKPPAAKPDKNQGKN